MNVLHPTGRLRRQPGGGGYGRSPQTGAGHHPCAARHRPPGSSRGSPAGPRAGAPHGAGAVSAEADLCALTLWKPYLLIVDVDLGRGDILAGLDYRESSAEHALAIALPRRGDLPTRLQAFAQGVDDVLAIPFAPEELAARSLVVLRRSYHAALPFTPVLRRGDWRRPRYIPTIPGKGYRFVQPR